MPDLQKLKYCHVNLALFGFAASMMLIAFFFFQKNLGLLPCPLCVTQRIFTIGFGVIALIAALHNPAPHKQRIYSVLIALTAALGASISARQVYLQ
ncbi:MAG: disulfide bond formation protein B, partial [Pseudomonadales bacterium]